MLLKTVGNVTFHFEPLIIFGILIAIILLVQIIRSIILEVKFRKVCKNLMVGRYDATIELGTNLLYSYQKYNARLSTKQITARIEYLNFSLAVSHFAKSDDAKFLSYINALVTSSDTKEFWLTLYYLQNKDFENAQTHYDRIARDESTYVNRSFLDAFRAYSTQEIEIAKRKMAEVVDQLKHPILKQIADKML